MVTKDTKVSWPWLCDFSVGFHLISPTLPKLYTHMYTHAATLITLALWSGEVTI